MGEDQSAATGTAAGNGVVYVASKLDRYVEEAFLSAESLKRHAPGIAVTLFTDRPDHPLCATPVFDSVLELQSVDGFGLAWAEGQLDRIACLARSPYEHTLNLDTDTRIHSPEVATVFRQLQHCDVAMVEARPENSYGARRSGRRMFNAGFILYRRSAAVEDWLAQWQARVRRNLGFALQSPLPEVPELAHVTDEEVRRTLLRMDQIALMEILSPEVNLPGLVLREMDETWNYRGATRPANVRIEHSEAFKASTRSDLLMVAREWSKRDGAQWQAESAALVDVVGAVLPVLSPRRDWRFWRATGPTARDEWALPALKRADLHLRFGQVEPAVECLQSPGLPADDAPGLAGRARVALMAGAIADAVDLATQAHGKTPNSAYTARVLGEALLAAHRPVDAIPVLQQALEAGCPESGFLVGQAWFSLRDFPRAVAAFRRAIKDDPADTSSANNLLPALLGAREYRAANAQADALLAQRPGHALALAFKCVALDELGEADALARLQDPGRLVLAEHLPAPKAYRDLRAFHRVLGQTLGRDPSLAYEPPMHTTRLGYLSGDLSASTSLAVQQLNAACLAAAERRMQAVQAGSGHPFDRSVPRVYRLHSWAVVMQQGGHQTPHIHAGGWLSGVYYVEVPEEVRADDPERNGWIEFGPAESRWYRDGPPAPVLQVCPQPGLLLTFPSWFWHNTRPLKSEQRRISFAFDIVPL